MCSSDYQRFLEETGLTEEAMKSGLAVSPVMDWMVQPGVIVLPSPIHGKGVFVQKTYEEGHVIASVFSFMANAWTPAGRYTNHSPAPNAIVFRHEDGFFLKAAKRIEPGEELTADYRQVMKAMQ